MRIRHASALLVALGVLAGCGGDGEEASTAGPTTTTEASGAASTSTPVATDTTAGAPTSTTVAAFGPEALEMAGAIERADSLTYHARYEGLTQTENGEPRSTVIEVWKQPPLARRDTTASAGDTTLFIQEFHTAEGLIGCLEVTLGEESQVQCQHLGEEESVDAAAATFEAVDPQAGRVTAVDDTIDGVAVRCFRVAALRPQELCFDGDGIPVVVDDGVLRLERTAMDADVTDADLVPPATPS